MIKTDFHTHILPGMDDGAHSVQESLQMLQRLSEQGVREVVLTPHYYSNRESLAHFTQRRRAAYERLLDAMPSQEIVLRLGCEVYLTELLFNRHDLSALCIEGTRTMLVELPAEKCSAESVLDRLDRLASDYLVTPVLAHVERYAICRSKKTLSRLLDMGCVLQVNLSSFAMRGKHRLLRLAANGCIGAVGTDSHNMTTRPPDYDTGYACLEKAISSDGLSEIQHTMDSLLRAR